jgi:hypothetical protein
MTLKHDFVETDVRQTRIRLTRAAVLVVIVLLFLGAALVLTAGRQVATSRGPAPLVTQGPAASPSSEASPTPLVCPDDPGKWRVRVEPGVAGLGIGRIDPPCVAEEVLANLKDALRWYYETPDRNPADAARYFADDPLASLAELMSSTVRSLAAAGQDFRVVVSPQDRLTYVGGFAPDGRQVSVVDRCPGGSILEITHRETGEVATREVHPAHLMAFTLTYDESDRRWKIESMEERVLDSLGDPQLYREVIEGLYGDMSISTPEEEK